MDENFLSQEEINQVATLLLNRVGGVGFRASGTVGAGRTFICIEDFIEFLTNLVDECPEDNKQMAFKGLRILLRGYRQHLLKELSPSKKK